MSGALYLQRTPHGSMRAMVTLALNRTLSEIESFEWARWVAGLIGVEHVLLMHQEPRLREVMPILGE